MRQRLQFGAAESLGKVALRGGFGGTATFIVPRFGARCVCCNADAMGRTKAYNASTDRVEVPPIPMPVCATCDRHALQQPLGEILAACALVVGLALVGLGIMKLGERPDDHFLWAMIGGGAALFVAAIVWIVIASRRRKASAIDGHHPGLQFSVAHGRTLLDTDNHELVEELLAHNPSARRLPTPWLWRRKAQGSLPTARTRR